MDRTRRWHTWLIAAAVLLRSFIAPGYMLAVTGGDLHLAFCYGPVAAAQASQDHGEGHQHHASDAAGDETTVYVSPSCSFWSTSSLLATGVPPVIAQAVPAAYHEPVSYDLFLPAGVFEDARAIRAPPVPA